MRYPALRVIIVLQYLTAAFVALGLIFYLIVSGQQEFLVKVSIVVGGVFGVLAIISVAEVLKVLIHIEENTRRAE